MIELLRNVPNESGKKIIPAGTRRETEDGFSDVFSKTCIASLKSRHLFGEISAEEVVAEKAVKEAKKKRASRKAAKKA